MQGFCVLIFTCRCRGTPKRTLISMPGLCERCSFIFVVFGRDRKSSVIGRWITFCNYATEACCEIISLFFYDCLPTVLIKWIKHGNTHFAHGYPISPLPRRVWFKPWRRSWGMKMTAMVPALKQPVMKHHHPQANQVPQVIPRMLWQLQEAQPRLFMMTLLRLPSPLMMILMANQLNRFLVAQRPWSQPSWLIWFLMGSVREKMWLKRRLHLHLPSLLSWRNMSTLSGMTPWRKSHSSLRSSGTCAPHPPQPAENKRRDQQWFFE